MRPIPQARTGNRRGPSAFSLVELMAMTGVLFVLSAIAMVVMVGAHEKSKAAKLRSDVATINSAIKIYLASGGTLKKAAQAEDALDALKTTRSSKDAKRFAGAPASSMIDRRITAVMQTAEEAGKGDLRARWDRKAQRFVLSDWGPIGVKNFAINEDWAERIVSTEKRDGSSLAFSGQTENSWIWDTGKWEARRGDLAPTEVSTNPLATTETTPVDPDGDGSGGSGGGDDEEEETGGTPPEPEPEPLPRLPRPEFDRSPGTYPIDVFPLLIGLTNLPDPAIGDAYYYLSGGSGWTPYTGTPISVESGQTLYARSLAKDPEAYRDSYTKSGKFVGLIESFNGTSTGEWVDALGGPNLVSEITNDPESSMFEHGNSQLDLGGEILDAGVQNRITYEASGITGVAPNQQFEIGTLIMHNGTTFNDSEAESVSLSVTLDLGETGGVQKFNIPFAMENTENSDDRVASADVVQLLSTSTSVRPVINGVRYDLRLSIGIVDNNGVTKGTKFLVYEGATATGKIYGKFVPRY